jgi:hypothetical protein
MAPTVLNILLRTFILQYDTLHTEAAKNEYNLLHLCLHKHVSLIQNISAMVTEC